ncbi:hypothetical protein GPUN_2470 [Glaciecola punicea ACAM 611]|uniref:Uncharacterized protein n=1 Tax=Glaciecola punicea ACAM 611 TaxID=1121923 RepID=H5TE58_9ALTE|nr:hypothetical protein GPUN_2470 [Glaciecola punicea ACAM 611]
MQSRLFNYWFNIQYYVGTGKPFFLSLKRNNPDATFWRKQYTIDVK